MADFATISTKNAWFGQRDLRKLGTATYDKDARRAGSNPKIKGFRKMKKLIASLAAVLVLASAADLSAETDLKGVKCLMASKPASADKSADYKQGKVYFCCGGCASKFQKNTKKFATKANHQLVATKQYKQTGCPFSGRDVDASTSIKVAGTDVAFCCSGCKSKVESAKDDTAKIALVFSDKAFKQGFKKAEKKE